MEHQTMRTEYDVVICGGGLAGLTLARQLALEVPDAQVLVIEGPGDKRYTSAINVGESTVEISAYYLCDVLGLHTYLKKAHLPKLGLRFFFGDGDNPFQMRQEFGLARWPMRDSFQLDRKIIEGDLKQFNTEMHIPMLTAGEVAGITLADGEGLHEIVVRQAGIAEAQVVKARWVIDAMGRRRFLQKQLGLAQPHNSKHSAAWFRLPGRIDVCDLVPTSEVEWHSRVHDGRYYSTNHLMRNGRWVWLIPLSSGQTSVGIVAHEDFFPFHDYNTYEKSMLWLEKYEPQLRALIGDRNPIDFQCLRHYSYTAKQIFSAQRWACTGDAAIFADPFFSPGIDEIGYANTIITEMIKRDRQQQLTSETVALLNKHFLSFHNFTTWTLQKGYPFFGDALVMGTKLLWILTISFLVGAPQRFNRIYLDEQRLQALEPLSSRISLLLFRMEKLFSEWAMHASTRERTTCLYQFVNYLDAPNIAELYRRNLQSNKTLDELLVDHKKTLEHLEELALGIFLIALTDVLPEKTTQLPVPLWLNAWAMSLDPERWAIDGLFAPTTQPRDLKLEQVFALFGVTDLLSLLQQSRIQNSDSSWADMVTPER